MHTAVIISGGGPPRADATEHLPVDPVAVIAADSGLDHALRLGLRPTLLVGDLDSVSPDGLAEATAEGIAIERHPVDKDATDLALALDAAARAGADRAVVLGPGTERLDHLVAGLLALAAPGRLDVEAHLGDAVVQVVRPGHPVLVHAPRGATVSLVPVGGDVDGVTTAGLTFPLSGDTLPFGTTRGVSNVVASVPASVSITSGTLLVIEPGSAA